MGALRCVLLTPAYLSTGNNSCDEVVDDGVEGLFRRGQGPPVHGPLPGNLGADPQLVRKILRGGSGQGWSFKCMEGCGSHGDALTYLPTTLAQ